MADLGWTQPQWTALFDKLGPVVSAWFFAKRLIDQLGSGKITVDEYLDDSDQLSDWKLNGVVLGSNTDDDGYLYVDLADAAGTRTVSVYKDSGMGGGDLVAQGSLAGDGLITLAEQNSSGITGTVYVQYTTNDSNIFLVCTPSVNSQFNALAVADPSDTSYKAAAVEKFSVLLSYARSVLRKVESFARNEMISYIARKTATSEQEAGGGKESVSDGVVSVSDYGIIGELIDAMNDETNAGAQTVDTDALLSLNYSGAWDGDNVGQGTISISRYEHIIDGDYLFKCVGEDFPDEAFEVSVIDNYGNTHRALNNLVVEKTYHSLDLGIKDCTISRSITDSGAEADHFDQWAISGEDTDNTNNGIIYCKYTASTKLLELFKVSGRTADDLVASGTWDGIHQSIVTLAEQNSSGLSGTVRVSKVAAVDPVDTSTLQVSLNRFRLDDKYNYNAKKIGASFWNEFFGTLFKTNLPSATSGTIKYNPAHRGFSGLTRAFFDVWR